MVQYLKNMTVLQYIAVLMFEYTHRESTNEVEWTEFSNK